MALISARLARYRRGAGDVVVRRMCQKRTVENNTYTAIASQGGTSGIMSLAGWVYVRYSTTTVPTNTRTNACPRSRPRIFSCVDGSHLKGAINFDTRLVANMPFSLVLSRHY